MIWLFIGFIVGALLEWLSQIIFDTDTELEPEEEQQPAPPAPIMFTENQLVFLVSAGIVFGAFMGYFAH